MARELVTVKKGDGVSGGPFAVGHRVFRPGELYFADDPALQGREHLLEPGENAAFDWRPLYPQVEQATAAPGETRKRAPRKPKKG